MGTFIRIAEVWVPSVDGTLLDLAGGLFDAAPAFGAISRGMCFGRAEGLPGHAWEEGRPILLRRLEGSVFRRVTAAQAAGLGCALALPIFRGDVLTSVVVLLCGSDDSQVGAIELWHNDPRVESDLTLADGYFGASAPALEELSRDAYLPRGAGLPGEAWRREAAVFVDDVGESRNFLRAQTAAHAGIVRALALPCSTRTRQTWVLSLLSSQRTPIARRVESWLAADDGLRLQRGFGFCESVGGLLATGAATALMPAELGPIGLAWSSGVAQAERGVLAIPVMGDEAVSEVVALHL
ncbi:MAG TPA: GAF domain-containing protein [Methylibium sp.]|nr:GAF domain-containing protein [Methylibium sp.]